MASKLLMWRRVEPTAVLLLLLLVTDAVLSCGPGRGGMRRKSSHKPTPLVYKQHVPNVSENTLGASGLYEGRITRDDPRFKELAANYITDIIFKNEEGTGADRLMTQTCIDRLKTLSIAVMNQWPDVKLRVTEAWVEDNQHPPDSLHYEGRAVDVQTSDRDRSKNGLLARLAVEAGFDWVYYESRSHIHCSVKSESSEAARSGGCFHGDSVVYMDNGETKKIRDLNVHDRVLTADSNGALAYSKVILFLDRNKEKRRLFFTIETEGNQSITLTPSHLIYTASKSNVEFKSGPVIFAKDVKPGDYIYVRHTHSGISSLTVERVLQVRHHVDSGVFAPLTLEGTIVVDNVLASCYAVINSQAVAHWAFAPVRLYYNWKDFLRKLGTSSRGDAVHREPASIPQDGIHWYASFLYNLAHLVLPDAMLYR
ncbi:PREDICTED: sonic hedgehog protein A-like [Priapulus caudatus]|uniref:Hedgehog protein n=1 Tax=Priapulus caudatus TaxID=37621 RepID=A0ABM1DZP3_PRICU|nr:PREDICTED: sonic hedgehog protein A-like [Priapulus caudatus]